MGKHKIELKNIVKTVIKECEEMRVYASSFSNRSSILFNTIGRLQVLKDNKTVYDGGDLKEAVRVYNQV